MKESNKAIVILGGMGPQASIRLVEILIDKSIRDFGAKNPDEFPEIILDSIPIPDFISEPDNMRMAFRMLKERIRLIDNPKISAFAIACNTAHQMFDDLQSQTKTEIVSIIGEVTDQVNRKKISKIGLLASPSTIKSGLFNGSFRQLNIEVIQPTEMQQKSLGKIIRKVIRGEILQSDRISLLLIADSLKRQGAQGIILGCTELPLIFPKGFKIPIFDSLDILANALLLKLHGGNTI